MREFLRRITPAPLLRAYHYTRARLAAEAAGHPSWKLLTIGVTGTNGKSTVVALIGHIFRTAGWRVGWISTATIRIADREWLNSTKLTMPDPFYLQDRLADMLRAGCRVAIIETSSEGLAQFRHVGIRYDAAVFTNLTPEHLEAHGSFEAYRREKARLFDAVAKRPKKTLAGQPMPRLSVVNLDDESAATYLLAPTDVRSGYSLGRRAVARVDLDRTVVGKNVRASDAGTDFELDGFRVRLPLFGAFNAANALAAIATAEAYGIAWQLSVPALETFPGVPGRLEFIREAKQFRVLVDYAPEPASMRALYDVIPLFRPKRIIHVFGSAGGGRDRWRRPVLGGLVATRADVCIVTNEDPYDEDPTAIIRDVANGVVQAGRHREGETLFRILDRREAIRKALSLARPGDIVVVTGKACEQWIMGPRGQRTAWDDRRVIREELARPP